MKMIVSFKSVQFKEIIVFFRKQSITAPANTYLATAPECVVVLRYNFASDVLNYLIIKYFLFVLINKSQNNLNLLN